MHSIVRASELTPEDSRTALFEGAFYGSGVTFFLVDEDPGKGPVLHRHPYTETWAVLAGQVAIRADDDVIEAVPGDIVTVGAGTRHKYRATGADRLRMVCIHASPRMVQEDLPDDDPDWLSF